VVDGVPQALSDRLNLGLQLGPHPLNPSIEVVFLNNPAAPADSFDLDTGTLLGANLNSAFAALVGIDAGLINEFYLGIRVAQVGDLDDDGIADDGNGSGTVGDLVCSEGVIEDCDDNCRFAPNGDQADADGNGIGDACQCGDVNGDGFTNVTDALIIARGLAGDSNPKCDVNGDGFCNITDALLIARGLVGSSPGNQLCPAFREPSRPILCGNGHLDPDEGCDDGNSDDGDCCSSRCQFEPRGSPCLDDGDVCTTDACNGAGGCTHLNNHAPCADAAFCTVGDFCNGGACISGTPSPERCNGGIPPTDDPDPDCFYNLCTVQGCVEDGTIEVFPSACEPTTPCPEGRSGSCSGSPIAVCTCFPD
jgi:cysteine-rich repeat protein